MRLIILTTLCLTLGVSLVNAQIQPETIGPSEAMPAPGENWFMLVSGDAGYVFDASNGEMHGLISVSGDTPAVQSSPVRREFYAAATYYSRGSYGDRTDVLTIHDFNNLSPVAEVEIPKKMAVSRFRSYIGLMSNGKHVGISNVTPALSVSIVDVENRSFVGEIMTPGCSLIMPVGNNDFMTICGDGTLMLIELDDNGNESNRVRSSKFFDVHEDAVFDSPVETGDGWLLVSHGGKAIEVSTSGSRINVSDAWEIVTAEDAAAGWWPGGGQVATVHKDLGLAYVTMHQGQQYSHHEFGTEIWVVSLSTRQRIERIEFEVPVGGIMVTQEANPLLIAVDEEGSLLVYDAVTYEHERTIAGPTPGPFGSAFEDL